ncbi:hypothetical protein ACH4YO_38330 [Streptomyces noursei]|uniref:hypothetical protein n=1 Tax=Streptomyces noursei TaxID=1971 RepID=UPI00081CFC9F|nr:hypothetical protein SNOUR_36450 [Streptomyces noursei ATCC 11455]
MVEGGGHDVRQAGPGARDDVVAGDPDPVEAQVRDVRRAHAQLSRDGFAGQAGAVALAPGLTRLADDLTTGRWHTRYAELLTLDTIDVGYRLLVSDA